MNFVKARDSRALIKSALKARSGGSAMVTVGDATRGLSHYPLRDAPSTRLPWPLSAIQPHNVQYRVFKGDTTLERKRFSWGEVDQAINLFLSGIDDDELVQIGEN